MASPKPGALGVGSRFSCGHRGDGDAGAYRDVYRGSSVLLDAHRAEEDEGKEHHRQVDERKVDGLQVEEGEEKEHHRPEVEDEGTVYRHLVEEDEEVHHEAALEVVRACEDGAHRKQLASPA